MHTFVFGGNLDNVITARHILIFGVSRIGIMSSQFLIMPPYQKQGHGSRLYRSLYNDFCGRKEIREMTGTPAIATTSSGFMLAIDHGRLIYHPLGNSS